MGKSRSQSDAGIAGLWRRAAQELKRLLGTAKAIRAMAASLLTTIYQILKDGTS